jgi:quinate dehydrogenase
LVVGDGGLARSAVYALWKWLDASGLYLVNKLDAEVEDIIGSMDSAGFPRKLTHVTSVA